MAVRIKKNLYSSKGKIVHVVGKPWNISDYGENPMVTKLLILCSKMKILWVESRDFSQAEKDITTCKAKQIHKMTPIFTQNNNLSENSCHFCEFAQFSKQSFARLKSKHLAQFFWWKVNLRELRGFILQKVQASVVERQKKKFYYPSFNFGKENTIIRIVSLR